MFYNPPEVNIDTPAPLCLWLMVQIAPLFACDDRGQNNGLVCGTCLTRIVYILYSVILPFLLLDIFHIFTVLNIFSHLHMLFLNGIKYYKFDQEEIMP